MSLIPPTRNFFTIRWAPVFTESSLETPLFGSTTYPPTLCGQAHICCTNLFNTRLSHKTKSLGMFLITTLSVSEPHFSKYSLKLSFVASKLKPPVNSFLKCSGFFGSWLPPPSSSGNGGVRRGVTGRWFYLYFKTGLTSSNLSSIWAR